MFKVLSAAALIVGMATSSFAGTIESQPVQQVQNDDAFAAAPSSSASNLVIPIVACLVICTLLLDDDSSNGTADVVVAD